MSPDTLLSIILAITVVGYFFDQALDLINLKSQRKDIPIEIEAFYEKDKYLKSLAYHRDISKFSFITSAVSFSLSIAFLFTGAFGCLVGKYGP